MSELRNARNGGRDFRRHLLASVSAAALAASVYAPGAAFADDTDRPTVWIELGGQLERSSGGQEPFAPAFIANLPDNFFSPIGVQKPLQYSYGGEGVLSFQPDGSDWIFSASVRYGRSNGIAQKHQETPNAKVPVDIVFPSDLGTLIGMKYQPSHVKFEDTRAQQNETHAVLDFQAGKDVGLGMFSNHGSSVLSAGIRFAQLSSKSSVTMHMEPDVQYPTKPITSIPELIAWTTASLHFHDDALIANSQRSFQGLGPSVAWDASAPFAGNPDRGEITLDWSANAAILFGRQKASGHHQTTVLSYYKKNGVSPKTVAAEGAFGTVSVIPHHYAPAPFNRMRTVIVPNLGGVLGLSFRHADEKISFGYRADFFFGAMDGGIDAEKKENRGFYGPFASISIGLGG